MKRSWMTGLGVAVLAPLAAGCGSATRPEGTVVAARTPPPFSVVSVPQTTSQPSAQSMPATGTVYSQPMPGMPSMGAVYAPRTQTVPAVVPNPPTAQPVIASPRTGGESTSMRVPTPDTPATVGSHQHNGDYTTLVGELHHNPRQNTWRLRYAGLGDEDRYGGSVTLDGVGRMMTGYKSGQTVRVHGVLVDAESREISPAFRVRDIHPMD